MTDTLAPPTSVRPLDALLADPRFRAITDLVAAEVARCWSLPQRVARGFVLSAIGEPATLRVIAEAWARGAQPGHSLGLAKLIIRRRVIDLLRKDARPDREGARVRSLEPADLERDVDLRGLDRLDPRDQLELQDVIVRVRGALDCFATQGPAQARQARLLQAHELDEVSYEALSAELACSAPALRVRVHKARLAFGRHVAACHAELVGLVGRGRAGPAGA